MGSETFELVYLRRALYAVFVISLVMWFATIFAVGSPTDVAGVIKHKGGQTSLTDWYRGEPRRLGGIGPAGALAPTSNWIGEVGTTDHTPRRDMADWAITGGPMELIHFAFNVGVALLMGVAIGLERQFRQHPAGLRTNALVCVGAALFVSLSGLMDDRGSPTRIASYIVSGIGFLGGGVILRDGLNVKGMNTAATLWCSAAVGTLAGAGFPAHALVGTVVVLGLHLGLRPVARRIDTGLKTAVDVETIYQMRVVCQETQEAVIRTVLLRHVNSLPKMTIQKLSTQDAEQDGRSAIVADIFSVERDDRAIQELMSRINIEPSVTSASWEKVTS